MIYEVRIYEAADGKADAMKARFKNEVVKRIPRPRHRIARRIRDANRSDAADLSDAIQFRR